MVTRAEGIHTLCQFLTHAAQQNAELLDHFIGAGEPTTTRCASAWQHNRAQRWSA